MLIAFKKPVQSEIRKRRSKRSRLTSWAGEENKALLIPSVRKMAWEVTLRCDGVLLARLVDPVQWQAGRSCSDGKVFSAKAPSMTDPAAMARAIDRLLRDKTVPQGA